MARALQDIEPVEMAWTEAQEASITWSDGHSSLYPLALLRSICPCAECRGTHTGVPKAFHIVKDSQLVGAGRQLELVSVEPVGNYAIAFSWGDGHKEGIYSWRHLRQSCPCPGCSGSGVSEPSP